MPNRQKQKGSRFESDCVKVAKDHGLNAYKVPLSGAGTIKNDIHIKVGRTLWEVECKKRNDSFKFLYKNIEPADILLVASDRKKTLAVIRYEDLCDLLAGKI